MRKGEKKHATSFHFLFCIGFFVLLAFTATQTVYGKSKKISMLADVYQTAVTAQTTVGTITSGTTSTNNIGSYADELKNEIVASCPPKVNYPLPGYVVITRGNQGCLNKILSHSSLPSKDLSRVIQQLHTSANERYFLQCTGFAQAVSIPFGFIGNAPSAFLPADYNHVSGYRWYSRTQAPMQPGDIVVWNAHIAVVVAVNTKTADFKVAEANGNNGTVGEEWYKNVSSQYGLTLYGFLRKT